MSNIGLPGPFVPITNIGKLSISGTDIPADQIIGTPLAGVLTFYTH